MSHVAFFYHFANQIQVTLTLSLNQNYGFLTLNFDLYNRKLCLYDTSRETLGESRARTLFFTTSEMLVKY